MSLGSFRPSQKSSKLLEKRNLMSHCDGKASRWSDRNGWPMTTGSILSCVYVYHVALALKHTADKRAAVELGKRLVALCLLSTAVHRLFGLEETTSLSLYLLPIPSGAWAYGPLKTGIISVIMTNFETGFQWLCPSGRPSRKITTWISLRFPL